MSTTSKGNYYKRKTKDWFEKQGYTVEICEFTYAVPIGGGRMIFKKKDILASDGIAYNKNEFILWNSKHTSTGQIYYEKYSGKKDYRNIVVPDFIKKQLIIWQPRKKQPDIIEC